MLELYPPNAEEDGVAVWRNKTIPEPRLYSNNDEASRSFVLCGAKLYCRIAGKNVSIDVLSDMLRKVDMEKTQEYDMPPFVVPIVLDKVLLFSVLFVT